VIELLKLKCLSQSRSDVQFLKSDQRESFIGFSAATFWQLSLPSSIQCHRSLGKVPSSDQIAVANMWLWSHKRLTETGVPSSSIHSTSGRVCDVNNILNWLTRLVPLRNPRWHCTEKPLGADDTWWRENLGNYLEAETCGRRYVEKILFAKNTIPSGKSKAANPMKIFVSFLQRTNGIDACQIMTSSIIRMHQFARRRYYGIMGIMWSRINNFHPLARRRK